jgi:hypothetical protein
MSKTGSYILAALFTMVIAGCTMSYSFTGASIPPEVKTIQIDQFPNNAPLVNPTLSQVFTDGLRDKYQSQTSLVIVTDDGDLLVEGEITDYNTRPAAVQSDDVAALNRLTITVKVTYTNKFDESQSFSSKTFSRYEDYDSSADLNAVADQLVPIIVEALVEDIFNQTVVNW